MVLLILFGFRKSFYVEFIELEFAMVSLCSLIHHIGIDIYAEALYFIEIHMQRVAN